MTSVTAAACSVDECEKPIYVKISGLCNTHYSRMRKTGVLTIARESPDKRCTKCGEMKPRSAFYLRKERDGGQTKPHCKTCSRAVAKEFRAANPEYVTTWNAANTIKKSDWHRFRQYGMTPDAYQVMFDQQGGLCAICAGDMGVGNVDHDHSTGVVRELLCHPCNIALGMFRDNRSVVASALEYLKRHSA